MPVNERVKRLEEKYKIPVSQWYHVIDHLTTVDEALRVLGRIALEQLAVLYDIKEKLELVRPPVIPPPVPPPTPPPTPEPTPPPTLPTVITLNPNRMDLITIDTSKTDEISLRRAGKLPAREYVAIWIENVGGGFEFSLMHADFGGTKFIKATDGLSIAVRFTDIVVKGSGTAGTGKIWVFWHE